MRLTNQDGLSSPQSDRSTRNFGGVLTVRFCRLSPKTAGTLQSRTARPALFSPGCNFGTGAVSRSQVSCMAQESLAAGKGLNVTLPIPCGAVLAALFLPRSLS